MPWNFLGPQGRLDYAQDARQLNKNAELYRTKVSPETAKGQQRGQPDPNCPVPLPGPRRDRIERRSRQEPWQKKRWSAWDIARASSDERTQAQQIESQWRLNPRYKRKRLGVGGNGIAEHFTIDRAQVGDPLVPVKEFVMKAPLKFCELSVSQERKALKKVAGAAHCVQMIDPELIGRREPSPTRYMFPDTYDSSISGGSSGEESIDEQPPKKRTRAWLNSEGTHKLEAKYQRFRQYQKSIHNIERARDHRIWAIDDAASRGFPRPPEDPNYPDHFLQLNHQEFVLMHYCTKGSVSSLITKLANRSGDDAIVPNRVLWSFWLCMIRACVAMAFPPRKFDPQRKRQRPTRVRKGGRKEMEMRALGYILAPDGDEYDVDRGARFYVPKTEFLEEIPPPSKRWREKRMVHFDIDPDNDDQRPAPAGGASAPTAASSQQPGHAAWIFKPGFPKGLRPESTRSEGRDMCGIHAIIDSFPGQIPGHKRVTRRELMKILDSEAYANCFPVGVPVTKTFFSVDALASVLHCWAKEYAKGRGYALIICGPDGSEVSRWPQEGIDAAQQSNLYLYYEGGDGHDGHYCALIPATDADVARQRAEKEKGERKAKEKARGEKEMHRGLRKAWEKDVLEEHAEIPMLKLADFGLARIVKPEKRNAYYHLMREVGKPGWTTPESFAKDWEYVDSQPDGHELGQGTELAGNWNGSSNIFQVALVMWQLITGLAPPEPPAAERARGLPAAYCPLLLDGGADDRVDGDMPNDYARVDPLLRRTVYRCLSHDQAHRPRLPTLLRDAKARARMAFDDFDEEGIASWVRDTWP